MKFEIEYILNFNKNTFPYINKIRLCHRTWNEQSTAQSGSPFDDTNDLYTPSNVHMWRHVIPANYFIQWTMYQCNVIKH